jgi:hypothetical protein
MAVLNILEAPPVITKLVLQVINPLFRLNQFEVDNIIPGMYFFLIVQIFKDSSKVVLQSFRLSENIGIQTLKQKPSAATLDAGFQQVGIMYMAGPIFFA